jgi:hypothetical protein
LLARVRPSTQSVDECPVDPDETADDVVEEVVDGRDSVDDSLFVDVGGMIGESLIVDVVVELLHILHISVNSSSCNM